MSPRAVVVLGSANADLVVRVQRLPGPGETIGGGEFSVVPGGKGANQAMAAALAGARVYFVGSVGRDVYGVASLRALRRAGVQTRYVSRHVTKSTGVALIMVDERGENLISVAGGANLELQPAHVEAALPAFKRARCLLAQLESPLDTVTSALKSAHELGLTTLLNPAPAPTGGIPSAWFRCVDWLAPNRAELAHLTGCRTGRRTDVVAAAQSLVRRGIPHVVVTCGADGACYCNAGGAGWFPALKVKPVDTVGAGDTFCGVLAAKLATGSSPASAISAAVTSASQAVARPRFKHP